MNLDIVVNLQRSKKENWLIMYTNEFYETLELDYRLAQSIIPITPLTIIYHLLDKLTPREKLPKTPLPLMFPRYIRIVMKNFEIVELKGVRRDLSPTKWDYFNPKAYWSMNLINKIQCVIKQYINEEIFEMIDHIKWEGKLLQYPLYRITALYL